MKSSTFIKTLCKILCGVFSFILCTIVLMGFQIYMTYAYMRDWLQFVYFCVATPIIGFFLGYLIKIKKVNLCSFKSIIQYYSPIICTWFILLGLCVAEELTGYQSAISTAIFAFSVDFYLPLISNLSISQLTKYILMPQLIWISGIGVVPSIILLIFGISYLFGKWVRVKPKQKKL